MNPKKHKSKEKQRESAKNLKTSHRKKIYIQGNSDKKKLLVFFISETMDAMEN